MNFKFGLALSAFVLLLACAAQGRHVSYRVHQDDQLDLPVYASTAGRRPHPDTSRSLSQKQARVFPGAVAIKKLVLLKFKKIIPISLILLKSSNENEAELVPVYPTSEIPADVQFIPTPNGISGHKDVQAIAIPTELHQQLEANGLANLENIEALLNEAQEENAGAEESTIAVSPETAQKDDELLNVKEEDEDQLLEGITVDKTKIATANVGGLRRLPVDEIVRPGLRASHQTAVEEIPLFLYSAKDSPQVVHSGRKFTRHHANTGRRYHS